MPKPPRGFSAAWAKNCEKSGQSHQAAGPPGRRGPSLVVGRGSLGPRPDFSKTPLAATYHCSREKNSLRFCSPRYGSHVKKHETRLLNGRISSMRGKAIRNIRLAFQYLG